MTGEFDIDERLVTRYIEELQKYGAEGRTGVTRYVYSPEWLAAQNQVMRWCSERGWSVTKDTVGNVWGRVDGRAEVDAVVSGSHIDTEPMGGRFDGALGVVAAILAIDAVTRKFGEPLRPIEVVSLCEEESSRFHANYWGSRTVGGRTSVSEAEEIRDAEGCSLAAAMRSVGLDPARLKESVRGDIAAFLELHVEQGSVLEQAGVPVGIVSGITAMKHLEVRIDGQADHAGARPMTDRRDALAGAAQMTSLIERVALEAGPPAVATVGRIVVEPNSPSVVPRTAIVTVDVRHPDDATLTQLTARLMKELVAIGARRKLGVTMRFVTEHDSCPCDAHLVDALEEAARELRIPAISTHSGAGHDSQEFGRATRVGMVFVRSRGGRSHTPEEFTSAADATAGIQILAATLHRLAYTNDVLTEVEDEAR